MIYNERKRMIEEAIEKIDVAINALDGAISEIGIEAARFKLNGANPAVVLSISDNVKECVGDLEKIKKDLVAVLKKISK